MSSFVLIHGAWHGGWCWDTVAKDLSRAGQDVYTPTLTGLAERFDLSDTTTSLGTHIADVVELVEREGLSQVVICAHSYGGMVATGAVDQLPGLVRSLVYLDAFVPKNGDSVASLSGAPHTDADHIPPPPASWFGLSGDDAVLVDAKLTPHPARTFGQAINLRRVPTCSRTYVLATKWESMHHFQSSFADASANPTWSTRTIDGSHDLMIDRPHELSAMLIDLGNDTARAQVTR